MNESDSVRRFKEYARKLSRLSYDILQLCPDPTVYRMPTYKFNELTGLNEVVPFTTDFSGIKVLMMEARTVVDSANLFLEDWIAETKEEKVRNSFE